MLTTLRQRCSGTLRAWLWFTKTELRPLLAPNIAYHLPPLSAPSRRMIHKAHSTNHVPELTHPQSLTTECNLPSFCVRLSSRILSQCFSLYFISQNTDWFLMDTAEIEQHVAESASFVFCSQLARCCSWHYTSISKIRKSLFAFMDSAAVASLRGLTMIWWFFILLHILTGLLSQITGLISYVKLQQHSQIKRIV